jgi:uncharacterized membrane protein
MSILAIYFSLHMIGLVIWLGAAFVLPIALIPALKSLESVAQTAFMKVFTKRYVPWFIVGGLLVGVTGYLQIVEPTMVEEMTSSSTLILKHVVIIPLIAASLFIWFVLARKLGKPETDNTKLMQQFVVFSWIQALLGVAVLVITGILTG